MKNKNKLIKYWLKSANSDLEVAEHLFEKGDYHYCLFLGHLVLEKTLKALYVKNVDINSPYKHSLPLLAQKSNLKLTDDKLKFLEDVTDFNIEARYPDKKFQFYKKCTMGYTEKYFKKIKDFHKWLINLIKLDQ